MTTEPTATSKKPEWLPDWGNLQRYRAADRKCDPTDGYLSTLGSFHPDYVRNKGMTSSQKTRFLQGLLGIPAKKKTTTEQNKRTVDR